MASGDGTGAPRGIPPLPATSGSRCGTRSATSWGRSSRPTGVRSEEVFEDTEDLLEELKAELLTCFAACRLRDQGHFVPQQVRDIQAAVVLRCLRPVRPTRTQPYETLWLMLANFLLDRDVLHLLDGRLVIRYESMDDAVATMLREVLEIQTQGSRRRWGRYRAIQHLGREP